jgi:hypothetical protein
MEYIYISQLIRYSRACGSYQDFLDRALLLTRKLLNQWFQLVKLKSSLQKFYGRHHDLVNLWEHLCHKWPRICSGCRKQYPVLSSFMRVSLMEQELLTLPENLSSPPVFRGVRVTQSLALCVMFCRSLFVLLAIVLSILLRFTDSDYPFGIFKLFLSSTI